MTSAKHRDDEREQRERDVELEARALDGDDDEPQAPRDTWGTIRRLWSESREIGRASCRERV